MYHRGRDPFARPNPKRHFWWWAAIVVVLALGLVFAGSFISSVVNKPVYLTAQTVSSGNWLSNRLVDMMTVLVRGRTELLAENFNQKERIALLEAQMLAFEDLKNEHAILLGQVSEFDPGENLVIGRVLTSLWVSPFDTLLVELPAPEAVVVNSPVTFGDALYLGRVIEVNGSRAKIQLLSAPGTETAVYLATSTASSIAVGRGGGNFQITFPRGIGVAVGDIVQATSSPADWYLGRVGAVEHEPSDSSQTVYVRYPVNLNTLRFVEIHALTN